MYFYFFCFFFFNDTATTEIYTLSLHDALPISPRAPPSPQGSASRRPTPDRLEPTPPCRITRPMRAVASNASFSDPLYLTSVRQCRTDFTNRSPVRTVCQQA